jgi:tetratricopeptide (TPR) repeat protein
MSDRFKTYFFANMYLRAQNIKSPRLMKAVLLIFITALSFSVQAQTLKDAIKTMENEQYEKASGMFLRLIQKEPTNGEMYFYMGENYFRQNEIDSASIFFNKGIELNPNFPLNYVGAGKISWVKNDKEGAKKPFLTATTIVEDKTNKTAQPFRALVYLKIAETFLIGELTEPQKSIDYVNKALAVEPKNPEAYILMGDAIFEQNNVNGTQAIEQYKKAAELDKTSPKPLVRRGILYMRARNPQEANKYFSEAITLEPNFAPAYRERAESYYKMGNLDKGIEDYKKYLSLNKGSVSGHIRYGIFLYVAKKYTEALAEFKQIQKDVPSNMVVQRLIAFCHYELGNIPQGLSAMETYFAKQAPEKVIARDYEYYGRLYQKDGKDSVALLWLEKAALLDSTNGELVMEIANIYSKNKKYAAAAPWYERKVNIKQGFTVNDYYYLGRNYYNMKEYAKADQAFVEYTKVQADIPFGYVWRGRCNSGLDPEAKEGLAKPHYEKVISLVKPGEEEKYKKDLEEAYSYLGYYYLVQKDFPVSKCCFEKVKNLNGGGAEFKKAETALASPELSGVKSAPNCPK